MSDGLSVASTTDALTTTGFILSTSWPAGFAFRLADDGLLLGHAFLGTFFFLLGAWHFYGIPIFRSRDLKLGPLRVIVLASIFKLVFCVIGILVENIFSIHSAYAHQNVYGGFAVAAITELIGSLGIVLPEGLDDAGQVLAFAVLGLIARAQAYGEVYLTGATRLLTSYTALFNAGIGTLHQMSAFRSRCYYSPLIGQVRAGSILLQGVWFWHAGAILRSPDRWAEQEHDNIMHLSIAFVWDAFVIIFIYILITALVGWLSRGRYGESADVKQAGKLSLQDSRTYQPLQNSEETSLTPKATESI